MFKLTEEQINEIIEMYGGTKTLINDIESRLNLIGMIEQEEDYYDIICAIISRIQTIKLDAITQEKSIFSGKNFNPESVEFDYDLDEIIKIELINKYSDLTDVGPENENAFNHYFK